MSYDIEIRLPARDACAACNRPAEPARTVGDWNCTRQANYVWRAAGIDLDAFRAQPTTACVAPLRAAIYAFAANPLKFRTLTNAPLFAIELESDSGLVGLLRRLLVLFESYPEGTVDVIN